MRATYEPGAIGKLFAGLTEYTFISELGMTDTRLIDYITELLTRFVHRDSIFALKDPTERRLVDLAEMLMEAERSENRGEARREIFRHIGDFALFWTGVYPEAIKRRSTQRDALLNYYEQGKKSYYIASTYSDTPTQAEQAPVLRRLSDDFELLAYGLGKVRSHWEEHRPQA
jgi:hypothetical protein